MSRVRNVPLKLQQQIAVPEVPDPSKITYRSSATDFFFNDDQEAIFITSASGSIDAVEIMLGFGAKKVQLLKLHFVSFEFG